MTAVPLPNPRRTVRLRLTLLYLGLFVASAVCLIVITYFLVAQQLPQVSSTKVSAGPGSQGLVIAGTGSSAGDSSSACAQLGTSTPPSPSEVSTCITGLQAQASHERGAALDQFLIESGIALGIMAVASVGLGWVMAGRVLRPLRMITSAARRISASNLHQRIAMTGPDDELKELGDTFDNLLGRLDASFRAQRQFVANASHELRTPLARQRTLLEVALRNQAATTAMMRTACERVLAAGEESERLIAAMLTLAHSERGVDLFEPVDLGSICTEVLADRDDTAAARDVKLVSDIAPAPGLGDHQLTERLVANLVDNALRYNLPGGRVELATGMRGGRGFLAIRNTGPVVPPDQLSRLFQPFQRLDGHRTRSPGGSGEGVGLGLTIVHAIASAHNAELRATPGPDGGLVIEVMFPALVRATAGK
jgi:signal transduction histidine kinase